MYTNANAYKRTAPPVVIKEGGDEDDEDSGDGRKRGDGSHSDSDISMESNVRWWHSIGDNMTMPERVMGLSVSTRMDADKRLNNEEAVALYTLYQPEPANALFTRTLADHALYPPTPVVNPMSAIITSMNWGAVHDPDTALQLARMYRNAPSPLRVAQERYPTPQLNLVPMPKIPQKYLIARQRQRQAAPTAAVSSSSSSASAAAAASAATPADQAVAVSRPYPEGTFAPFTPSDNDMPRMIASLGVMTGLHYDHGDPLQAEWRWQRAVDDSFERMPRFIGSGAHYEGAAQALDDIARAEHGEYMQRTQGGRPPTTINSAVDAFTTFRALDCEGVVIMGNLVDATLDYEEDEIIQANDAPVYTEHIQYAWHALQRCNAVAARPGAIPTPKPEVDIAANLKHKPMPVYGIAGDKDLLLVGRTGVSLMYRAHEHHRPRNNQEAHGLPRPREYMFPPTLLPSTKAFYINDNIQYYDIAVGDQYRVIVLDTLEVSGLGYTDDGYNPLTQDANRWMAENGYPGYRHETTVRNAHGMLLRQGTLQSVRLPPADLELRKSKSTGGLSQKQLEWLELVLLECRARKQRVVIMSHLLLHPGDAWSDNTELRTPRQPTPSASPGAPQGTHTTAHYLAWNYTEVLRLIDEYSDVVWLCMAGAYPPGYHYVDPLSNVLYYACPSMLTCPEPHVRFGHLQFYADTVRFRVPTAAHSMCAFDITSAKVQKHNKDWERRRVFFYPGNVAPPTAATLRA